MRCDGKNPNCDRRRELLAQLKCLISSMERKKPCEWDEPFTEPAVCCPAEPLCAPSPCCMSVKACKSFDFRSSIMYKCECIRRNGLQDRCMVWDCMGRPECMTKLYPVCGPGRTALLKLTDLGDAEVALRKFYCADQAREAALAAYCRLTCNQVPVCNRNALCLPNDCVTCPAENACGIPMCQPAPRCDLPSYRICTYPDPCSIPNCRDVCMPCDLPCELRYPCNPCNPPVCLSCCP